MDPRKYFAEDPAQREFGNPEGDEGGQQPNDPSNTGAADDGSTQPEPKKNHNDRRWDRLMKEREQDREKISELESLKRDLEAGKYRANQDAGPVPEHFKKMYEDGLTIEERWKLQRDYELRREEEIAERARQDVINQLTEQQKEQAKWEEHIDDSLADLEEKYNVDFTSGTPKAERLKKDFLKTVSRLSPKDADGNITQFAPFEDTYEFWSESRGAGRNQNDPNVDRKKELSSMGNSRPANNVPSTEAGEGGMWGWMKDIQR